MKTSSTITRHPKLKKRWKFLFTIIGIVIGSFVSLGYFFISTDAPIISGNVIRNVEYKPGLKLDVYLPTKKVYEKNPVVIYIHGGAWVTGLKETLNFNRFNQAARLLRESGYAIVGINYTLAKANRSPFPACMEDAADAVAWIENNARDYNFDIKNLGLFGESAGAHIAMMVAYTDPFHYNKQKLSVHFNYVVDIYGPNRLSGVYHTPFLDSVYSKLGRLPEAIKSKLDPAKYIFGFDPKHDSLRAATMMEMYSPYNRVNASSPPTLLIQGDSDRVVPVNQSITLQARLDSLGVENECHIVTGADHAFAKATPEQKTEIQLWIVKFIQQHYTESKSADTDIVASML